MTNRFAFVFPGQGSQHLGMCKELAAEFPIIEDVFKEASEAIGYDLWKVAEEGPLERLNSTEVTQPALLAAGVAVWRVWKEVVQSTPIFLAGHSLGEYTALVCADAIQFPVAIKLVEERGKYMQEAVPEGKGGMAAIIGLSEEDVEKLCHEASKENSSVSPANFNSIGQIVIAGESEAVDRAISRAKELGAKLAKKLPVSVPSHCDLMKPAALKLAEKLKTITIKEPLLPVINNADVASYRNPDQIKDALIRQLYSPVRWVETVQFFESQEVPIIIESGPGKVLTGLNKRISDNLTVIAITQPESFQEAVKCVEAIKI